MLRWDFSSPTTRIIRSTSWLLKPTRCRWDIVWEPTLLYRFVQQRVSVQTDLPIEAGHFLNMALDKATSTQLWKWQQLTMAMRQQRSRGTMASWNYSIVLDVNHRRPQQPIVPGVGQRLWVLRNTVIQHLPELAERVSLILNSCALYPLQRGFHLPRFGVNTSERLRSNPAIMEWTNANTNMAECIGEFNIYHSKSQEEEDISEKNNMDITAGWVQRR